MMGFWTFKNCDHRIFEIQSWGTKPWKIIRKKVAPGSENGQFSASLEATNAGIHLTIIISLDNRSFSHRHIPTNVSSCWDALIVDDNACWPDGQAMKQFSSIGRHQNFGRQDLSWNQNASFFNLKTFASFTKIAAIYLIFWNQYPHLQMVKPNIIPFLFNSVHQNHSFVEHCHIRC